MRTVQSRVPLSLAQTCLLATEIQEKVGRVGWLLPRANAKINMPAIRLDDQIVISNSLSTALFRCHPISAPDLPRS